MALLNTTTKQVARRRCCWSLAAGHAVPCSSTPTSAARHRVRDGDRRDRARTSSPATPARSRSGHAFFLAIGAYTAAVLSAATRTGACSASASPRCLIWLPAAGMVAALAGVARRAAGHPAARALPRHRDARAGLHRRSTCFGEWSEMTGGAGIGRPAPVPTLFGARSTVDRRVVHRGPAAVLLMLVLLVLFALPPATSPGRGSAGPSPPSATATSPPA